MSNSSMSNITNLSILLVLVSTQSAFGSRPRNFPRACSANGIGHRLQSITCSGCICTSSNSYFCQNCVRITEVPESLRRQGCTFKPTSRTNFPDCCPKVECPEGVNNWLDVENKWPVAKGQDTNTNRQQTTNKQTSQPSSSRFVEVPRDVCQNEGIGGVIKSKRCEGCVCTSRSGAWFCRRCTTFTVPSSLSEQGCVKATSGGSNFPDCCPKIVCPEGVNNWFTITNTWPTV